jgi:hypothetical protein
MVMNYPSRKGTGKLEGHDTREAWTQVNRGDSTTERQRLPCASTVTVKRTAANIVGRQRGISNAHSPAKNVPTFLHLSTET